MPTTHRILAFAPLAATLVFATLSHAMTIKQFDELGKTGDAYVAYLIQAAEKSLIDVGRPDDAAKVSQLFTTKAPDSKFSIGLSQFFLTLAIARVADADKHAKNPDAARATVEKVMAVSLEKNDGVKLPQEFFTAARDLDKEYAPPEKKK